MSQARLGGLQRAPPGPLLAAGAHQGAHQLRGLLHRRQDSADHRGPALRPLPVAAAQPVRPAPGRAGRALVVRGARCAPRPRPGRCARSAPRSALLGYQLTRVAAADRPAQPRADARVCPGAPRSTQAVLLKTAADQLLWAPAMTCVFFAFLKTLEGHPEAIVATIQVRPRGTRRRPWGGVRSRGGLRRARAGCVASAPHPPASARPPAGQAVDHDCRQLCAVAAGPLCLV